MNPEEIKERYSEKSNEWMLKDKKLNFYEPNKTTTPQIYEVIKKIFRETTIHDNMISIWVENLPKNDLYINLLMDRLGGELVVWITLVEGGYGQQIHSFAIEPTLIAEYSYGDDPKYKGIVIIEPIIRNGESVLLIANIQKSEEKGKNFVKYKIQYITEITK